MKKTLPLVLLLLTLGCQPTLNQEMTKQLDMNESATYDIPAISKEQTINVSVTAVSGKVNIHVFLRKDGTAVENAINQKKPLDKVLDHKLAVPEANLKVTIPANEAAQVRVEAAEGKKAEFKMKLTN